MKFKNITESELIKTGAGKVKSIIINSHNAGTIKLIDGLANGAVATSTLTSAGAMVPADYATSTLTSTGTAVANGDTVTIGARVYTARTTLTYGGLANEVLIGSVVDGSAFLANLKKAINLMNKLNGRTAILSLNNSAINYINYMRILFLYKHYDAVLQY